MPPRTTQQEKNTDEALRIMRDQWSRGCSLQTMKEIAAEITRLAEIETGNGAWPFSFISGQVKTRQQVLSEQGRGV